MLYLRSFKRFILIGLALLGLSVSSVNAATVLTNPSQFSGSETLLTFQGAGTIPGDEVSNYGGVNFALSSGDAAQYRIETLVREFGPAETSAIDNIFGQSAPYPDLTMTFSSLISRVGFEMRTNFPDDIGVTMSLSAGGSIVDTHSFTTSGSGIYYFYAFETAVLFDELIIDVDESINGAFALDNLRFEAVNPIPVPAAVWLFGTALIGLLGFGKRSKAA